MKKIFFDASVVVGQFYAKDSSTRIGCKNSQTVISLKPDSEILGFCTFNEIGLIDATLWGIDQGLQTIFFSFMDLFYSVKNIKPINLGGQDTAASIQIAKRFSFLKPSNILSCAAAISSGVDEFYTLYPNLMSDKVKDFLMNEHKITLKNPSNNEEYSYDSPGLEELYQRALQSLTSNKVELLDKISKL